MPLIPLELIDLPPHNVRAISTSPETDDGLLRSIAALGVLTPILLRPNGNSRYWLIAGRRRLKAAEALGLKQVPAHVDAAMAEQKVHIAQAAENMVRAAMEPVDQWRAMKTLRGEGWTLAAAAAALGIEERLAGRLEKLGALHPSVLAAIEAHDMPSAFQLARIAGAPQDVQAAALKGGTQPDGAIYWHAVTQGCDAARIPQNRAEFDVNASGIAWEEDLFAEPGATNAIFTTDVKGFLAQQRAALEAQIAKAPKGKIRLVKDNGLGAPKLPKDLVATNGDADHPKKTEIVLLSILEKGHGIGSVVRTVAAAPKAKADKSKKQTAAPPASDDDAGQEAEDDADTSQGAPATPRTAANPGKMKDALARAKLQAFVSRLRDQDADISADLLLACVTLALSVHGSCNPPFEDSNVVSTLVPPGGAAMLQVFKARSAAAEMLASVAYATDFDGSDPEFEWIGHAIGADAYLPRFDTEDYLRLLGAAELRGLIIDRGDKPATTTAGMRFQLVGKLPEWRPAVFGAPGPKREPKQ